MKLRTDFVTNSSSSSFIIYSQDVDVDDLIYKILKELYIESHAYDKESEIMLGEQYDEIGILYNEDSSIGLFPMTKEEILDSDSAPYIPSSIFNNDLFYLVTNNGFIRFDRGTVANVMNKYDLDYVWGECD